MASRHWAAAFLTGTVAPTARSSPNKFSRISLLASQQRGLLLSKTGMKQ